MASHKKLVALANVQHGYFTAKQAIGCGFYTALQFYHCQHGNWEKAATGLYRLPNYADSLESILMKWHLWSRNQKDQPQGIISHESALAYYGLGAFNPQQVHLTVPARFQKQVPPEVVLHRASLNLSEIESPAGFMVTRLCRTLQDLRDVLAGEGRWPAIIEQALRLGRLSGEEASQLSTPAGAVLAAVPEIPALVPCLPLSPIEERARDAGREISFSPLESQLRGETAPEAVVNSDHKRERVYQMLFERAQALRSPRRRAQAGFTLVELLVVTAIISVLAGMLLPSLEKAVNYSREIACKTNEKNIGLALSMYAQDGGDRLPELVYYHGASYNNGTDSPWDYVILPYLSITSLGQKMEVFRCPIDSAYRLYGPLRPQSYIYNANRTSSGSEPAWAKAPAGKKLGAIKNASQAVLAVCGNVVWLREPAAGSRPTVALNNKNGIGYCVTHYAPWGDTSTMYFDHNGGSTYLMVDGHVSSFRNLEMYGYWQLPYGNRPSMERWCITQ